MRKGSLSKQESPGPRHAGPLGLCPPQIRNGRHITQSIVFLSAVPPVWTRIPKTMQTPWQNNDSHCAGCTVRTLIIPYENEHLRWSMSQATVQLWSAPGAAAFATGRRLLPSGERTFPLQRPSGALREVEKAHWIARRNLS